MEIRVKVVEADGKKYFEYQGVRFERHGLEPLFSPSAESVVSIFRNGKLFDWGTIAWKRRSVDAGKKKLVFFGFRKDWSKKEFRCFRMRHLCVGDEIVQSGNKLALQLCDLMKGVGTDCKQP